MTYAGDKKLNSWYITHLAVRTSCQGSGMGKALLQHVEQLVSPSFTLNDCSYSPFRPSKTQLVSFSKHRMKSM